MSIFADMDTMSSIRGLSTEANQRSVNDLFEHHYPQLNALKD